MGILDNKISLVTGASKNIGAAIAISLAKEGSTVFINYNSHEDLATNVLKDARKYNPLCEIIKSDVSEFFQVEQMINKIVNKHGKIDILVNNAGINSDKTLEKMEIDSWSKVLDVNLTGVFNVTKCALPHIPDFGNIINISSLSADYCLFGQSNYASSKAAINAFTKSISKELAKRKIRVNAISPGFIDTEMTKQIPLEVRKKYIEMIPLKRFGKSEDITKTLFYILNTDYLTGSIIRITGGL
tara:strand:- start:52 stop:780 length:729 start_codon:yes stop_codon:yes gene_type:complete